MLHTTMKYCLQYAVTKQYKLSPKITVTKYQTLYPVTDFVMLYQSHNTQITSQIIATLGFSLVINEDLQIIWKHANKIVYTILYTYIFIYKDCFCIVIIVYS